LKKYNGRKKHEHDCSKCIFLGSFTPKEGNCDKNIYDLYYHPDEEPVFRSLIARYGNEGGSYLSGMIFGVYDREDLTSPLGEAWRRAKQKGLKVQEKGYEEK
jgi:hypothetical protein